MYKKIISIFLSIIFVIGVMPIIAFADNESDQFDGYKDGNIIVAGIEVTNNNKDDVLGDGTVKYDPETYTLTLSGCNIEYTSDYGILSYEEVLKIVVADGTENTLVSNESCISGEETHFTFSGGGTLNLTSYSGSGINTEYGSISLYCDKINIIDSGTGISTVTGNVSIAQGTLSIINCDEEITSIGEVNLTGGNLFTQCKRSFTFEGLIIPLSYNVKASEEKTDNPTDIFNVDVLDEYHTVYMTPKADYKQPTVAQGKYLLFEDACEGFVIDGASKLTIDGNEVDHGDYRVTYDTKLISDEYASGLELGNHSLTLDYWGIKFRTDFTVTPEEYGIKIAGKPITVQNKDDVLGDGTVKYDPETKTVTLSGCNIKSDATGIFSGENELTVFVAEGTVNTIKAKIFGIGGEYSSFNIIGGGTLKLQSESVGLYSLDEDITIDCKELYVEGGYNGIVSINGSVTFADGNVTVVNCRQEALSAGDKINVLDGSVFVSSNLVASLSDISIPDGYAIKASEDETPVPAENYNFDKAKNYRTIRITPLVAIEEPIKAEIGKDLSVDCGDGNTKFIGIAVDGSMIDESNYIFDGSELNLDTKYIDSLEPGQHTLDIVFEDSTVEVKLTVENKAEANKNGNGVNGSDSTQESILKASNKDNAVSTDNSRHTSPKTGGNSHVIMWMSLLAASSFGVTVTRRKKKSAVK